MHTYTCHTPGHHRFDHVDVNGPGASPLYSFLKERLPLSTPSDVRSRPNGDIEWVSGGGVGGVRAGGVAGCAVEERRSGDWVGGSRGG